MKQTAIGAIIATLLAGGSAGGYVLVRDHQADLFEESVHQVVHVVDGDTIDIENEVRIRLLGIDAPEKDECFFEESRAAAEELMEEQHITIEKDISGSDRYGRLLRYVYVPAEDPAADELFVNEHLVREGYAFAYGETPDNRYRDLLAAAQEEARTKERGVWAACDTTERLQDLRALREKDTVPPDPDCTIKGNISEKGNGRLYFTQGCPNYNRIKIDTRKGEAFFCSEEEAQDAGFTRSDSCDNTF